MLGGGLGYRGRPGTARDLDAQRGRWSEGRHTLLDLSNTLHGRRGSMADLNGCRSRVDCLYSPPGL